MIDQNAPLIYSPYDGKKLFGGRYPSAEAYRKDFPTTIWKFNPWTGVLRFYQCAEKDPHGVGIDPHAEEPGAVGCTENATVGGASPSALGTQVGGGHYKDMPIQPIEYIHKNGLGFCEGAVVKYVSRWRSKGGVEDLKKARHFLDMLIEMEGSKP